MKTRKGFKIDTSITVVNVGKLKTPSRGHLLIHFDAKQWKKATAKLKSSDLVLGRDKLPEDAVAFVPVAPNRPDAGMLVLPDMCGNGCVKRTWPKEDGLGRCDCGQIPEPAPMDEDAPQRQNRCSVVLIAGTFRCVGVGCGRNCLPELRFLRFGSFSYGFVVCVCH
jgi:hypothetical protein